MPERYENFIGGKWTPPDSGVYIPDLNPADTRDIVGEFPNSTSQDALNALDSTRTAAPEWAALAAPARGEYLRKAADILAARADAVAADLMREEGKSLPEAKGETLRGVALLRYYAAETWRPDGEVIPSAGAATWLMTKRVPLGVVSLITPWNFPIAIPLWKAAPALAFGNAVVMKPSEHAPKTAWHIAKVFEEAGLPAGVFNVVFGEGARTGETLTANRRVNGVSFTGSARTGRLIRRIAAEHGKKVQLEMGGKNAVVVLKDADLNQALALTIQGAFKSAGEKCTATSRVIVAREIYAEFKERLVQMTKALTLGPGDFADAYLGPVISSAARENILKAVEAAKAEGAELLCGGKIPEGSLFENGFFIEPAIFDKVRINMTIAREEVFGPVLCLMEADGLEDAVYQLNETDYGLSASLFTRDLNAAMYFAERAQAGMIRINGETAGVEPQAPFGGMKNSSSYSREQGQAARDFYTQIKTISFDRGG